MDDCATQFDIEKPVKRQLKSQKLTEKQRAVLTLILAYSDLKSTISLSFFPTKF